MPSWSTSTTRPDIDELDDDEETRFRKKGHTMTTFYFIDASNNLVNLPEGGSDGDGVWQLDCDACRERAAANPGILVADNPDTARSLGHTDANANITANSTNGSVGFISYAGENIRTWNADATPRNTPEAAPRADPPTGHSLFVAVALANGRGGVIRRPDGGELRIIRCDSTGDGSVRVNSAANGDTDAGASDFPYRAFPEAEWHVVSLGTGEPETGTPEPTPSGYVLPRNAAAAVALAAQLQDFARWLPGGELEDIAHGHAHDANLCGEYEHIVCPTFGWTPRRGEENSMARYSSQFFAEMDAFERVYDTLPPLERLTKWMERYEAGGFANTAVVDHADTHLESHKRESVNGLLEGVLGWEAMPVACEYEVSVRVERTITFDVSQYVTVTVTADDEDAAHDAIDAAMLADYVVDYDWSDENGDTHYASTSRYDIDDYSVSEVNPA